MIQIENAVARYKLIILDELFEQGITCWIAGGALRDYFMGVPVNTDYDLFFPDQENQERAVKYMKDNGCDVKWESDNGAKFSYKGKTFDIVKKYFTSPQETIDNFDFTVSMFAVDREKLYYGESSFIDLAKRQLMFNKIPFPASSLSRAFRYYKKGFQMCKEEMAKLVKAINQEEIEYGQEEGRSFYEGMGKIFIGID